MIDLLLAAPGIALEPALVAAAPAHGIRVLRRCLDAADLLAAAAADPRALVVVSGGLPRLSGDVVARLRDAGPGATRPVVGLVADAQERAHLLDLGVPAVAVAQGDPGAVLAALVSAAVPHVDAGVRPTGVEGPSAAAAVTRPVATRGEIVVVWGPQGAPGRTTVAIGLAEHLAATGRRVCLVDADTYAPSVTMALGIVEDSSGVVVACRRAELAGAGPDRADEAAAVTSAARAVAPGWAVLGGLSSPDRWPELRPAGLERLWAACAAAFEVTVVDVGFCLEADDEGPWSRPRNAAAVSALSAAGHLVVVGDASPLGAARLAAAWPGVQRIPSGRAVTVARNRASGRDRGWEQVVRAAGVPAPAVAVPADARGLAACWRRGQSLAEGARRSSVRRALADLADAVVSG